MRAAIFTTSSLMLLHSCLTWVRWIFLVVALLVLSCAQVMAENHFTQSEVRIAGPGELKAFATALFTEFNKTNHQAALNFKSVQRTREAAFALLSNRDMVMVWGKVDPSLLGRQQGRWQAVQPVADIIGAQAISIIVHQRNRLKTLSKEQLQSLFSPRARKWSEFGGQKKTIHKHGLSRADPISLMFHDRVLPPTRCGFIMRHRTSKDVIAAITTDPYAVGYIDSSTQVPASLRTVPLNSPLAKIGKSLAVKPNAQSIRDGKYFLSRALVLYTNPQALKAAHQFAEFIRSEDGQTLTRLHGMMPSYRDTNSSSVVSTFDTLYGPDLKRVQATKQTDDDLTLGRQLLQAVNGLKLEPSLVERMCETAFELAQNARTGQVLAFQSAGTLAAKHPERRVRSHMMRFDIYYAGYRVSQQTIDADRAITSLINVAEQLTVEKKFSEAQDIWAQALDIAQKAGSWHIKMLTDRESAFEARALTVKTYAQLSKQIIGNPQNKVLRHRMLMLLLTGLDDPVHAADYLDATTSESMRIHVPLAAEAIKHIDATAALSLAEWYVQLARDSDLGAAELMRKRARKYYTRFLELHQQEDDLRTRANLGLLKMGGKLPQIKKQRRKSSKRRQHHPRLSLAKGQLVTDAVLADFIASNASLSVLTPKQIGSSTHLTHLDSFTHLQQLRVLHLNDAGKIVNLQPLTRLPKLQELKLSNLAVQDTAPLSRLSLLTTLELTESSTISAVPFINGMKNLSSLSLRGCTQLRNLNALTTGPRLKQLSLARCTDIIDLSPLGTHKDSLTHLNLSHLGQINEVRMLASLRKLRHLDLSHTKLEPGDLEWLKRQLPACRILQ